MKISIIPVLMAGTLCLAGCADGNYRTYTLDDSFGKTANHLVSAQISDPQAAKNPPANSPRTMDGYAGVRIMKGYRDGFGQDVTVQPTQSISIGTLTGSGSGN
ncbi:MAG: hypothetical protein ACXW1W_05255 [Methylococcaceae bacterium]